LKRHSDGIEAGTKGEGMNRKDEIDQVVIAGTLEVRASESAMEASYASRKFL
jgi:hypothetical protein